MARRVEEEAKPELSTGLPKRKPKALGLLSGGLDSTLAARILKEQGVEVEGVHFSTGFCRVVVDDELLERRRWATLFSDESVLESFLDDAMQSGDLEVTLEQMEAEVPTPVRDLLLLHGWARVGRFERAGAAGARLAEQYPGDSALTVRVLELLRSLAMKEPKWTEAARGLAERSSAGQSDATELLEQMGELEMDMGRATEAVAWWRHLVERAPYDAEPVTRLATILWDYGEMKEALRVIKEGRARLGRPRLLAFESAVLREELGDVDGAVADYLVALQPSSEGAYWVEERAARRLAELVSRPNVRAALARRLERIERDRDEEGLIPVLSLLRIEPDDLGLRDDGFDASDLPADPVGRELREQRRGELRDETRAGMASVREMLLASTLRTIPRARSVDFLDRLESRVDELAAGSRPREAAPREAARWICAMPSSPAGSSCARLSKRKWHSKSSELDSCGIRAARATPALFGRGSRRPSSPYRTGRPG